LLHWVDITRLNPFIDTTGFSPATTPVRQGRRFGHDLSVTALSALPLNTAHTVYDSYLYLAPGEPADEPAMVLRYLQQTADIYDLIAHPVSALASARLAGAGDAYPHRPAGPDTWVL
jgi:hypothetical protein